LAISKSRKEELVAQYQELMTRSSGLVLTTFSGMSVKEFEALRKKLREVGGEFQVVKNTLLGIAFQRAGLSLPPDASQGTTAVGFALADVPAVVKAVVEKARESELLQVKGAVIDGVTYNRRQVETLAELPAMPILRARLLGAFQGPAGRITGTLAGSVRQIVNVLSARVKAETAAG